jgi:hypothetical protein
MTPAAAQPGFGQRQIRISVALRHDRFDNRNARIGIVDATCGRLLDRASLRKARGQLRDRVLVAPKGNVKLTARPFLENRLGERHRRETKRGRLARRRFFEQQTRRSGGD